MRVACLLALLVPVAAHAADPDPIADTIVVTGKGLDRPGGEASYDRVIITRERLAFNASSRIEDILRDVAGFQQFRRTDSRAANPTSQGATLRALGGNASSRALVLLDGVPQADPFSGYIAWSALRPERLASAIVTRGGGIGAFGVGAVGGTIELISGGPVELPQISARAAIGSRNATELSGGVVGLIGNGFVSVHGGWDRGDGYRLLPPAQRGAADIPAAYDAWSIATRAVAALSPSIDVQGSALVFDDHRLRGLAGTASRSRGNDASLRVVSRGPLQVDAIAYIQERGFRSGFVAVAADRSGTVPTLDQFSTPSLGLGAKLEVRPPVGDGRMLRFGLDWRQTSGQTNEAFRYVGGLPTRIRRAGGVSSTVGGFAEASADVGPLTVTGGARLDRWSIRDGILTETALSSGVRIADQRYPDRAGTRPSFRAGALLRLSDRLDLRAAGYTGFRVPTLNELYRPFRVGADATAANAALGLERLVGAEGGAIVRLGAARLDLAGFWNRLDGAIANVTLGAGPGVFSQVGFVVAGGVFRQRLNLDAIVVRGVEASATIPLGKFTLSASYAYSDARVRARGAAVTLKGKRPAQTPVQNGSATLGFRDADLQGSLTVRYAGPQSEDDLGARRLPPAFTIDAVVGVPLSDNLRLVARAENLFDEKIVSGISGSGVEDLGTPQTVWLGLSFSR